MTYNRLKYLSNFFLTIPEIFFNQELLKNNTIKIKSLSIILYSDIIF
jgi:hypothetical protein